MGQASGATALIVQEKVGGPRAGNGAAARDAARAAGTLCSTWVGGRVGAADAPATGGGALVEAHSGQSSAWPLNAPLPPSSVFTSNFIAPEAEQINSMACGLTMGDAIATPMDSTNHTSTKQAKVWGRRRTCMTGIMTQVARVPRQPSLDIDQSAARPQGGR